MYLESRIHIWFDVSRRLMYIFNWCKLTLLSTRPATVVSFWFRWSSFNSSNIVVRAPLCPCKRRIDVMNNDVISSFSSKSHVFPWYKIDCFKMRIALLNNWPFLFHEDSDRDWIVCACDNPAEEFLCLFGLFERPEIHPKTCPRVTLALAQGLDVFKICA
jgi:hypothetical protein